MIVERIDPTSNTADPRQIRLHEDRYDFAMRMCIWDRQALDLGCGVGYGTKLLADVSRFVIGIDNNAAALLIAKRNYADDKVSYIKADAHDFWTDRTMHNLVGLEILEHLEHPVVALENIKRMGVQRAILSTPLNEKAGDNKYHKWVWTVEGFKRMVESAGYTYIGRSLIQPDNWTGVFSSVTD